MKLNESAPGNTENAERSVNENTPWDSLAEVPFGGGDGKDENAERIREQMAPDETATSKEQKSMQKEQEEADRNMVTESPTGKDFENYVDGILNKQ